MKKEIIWIKSESRKIHAVFITPNQSAGKLSAVLLVHGMTSSNNSYVTIGQELAKKGVASLSISLSGHGESEGIFNNLSVNDLAEDGCNAIKFLVNHKQIDPAKVGALGTSVGAHIVGTVSAKFDLRSLVLRVPAVYTNEMLSLKLSDIMSQEETAFRLTDQQINDTPVIQAISQFKGSLLVITSENDQVIPLQIPKKYISCAQRAHSAKIVQIDNATHNLSKDSWRKQFVQTSIDWFCKTLE